MKNIDIIILSSDDWGWKTSKYQLSIRFANDNNVLFVSSVGFRNPTASKHDLLRVFNKLRSFCKGLRKITPSLFVLTPLVIPFRTNKFVMLANKVLLRLQLWTAMRRLSMKHPYVFVFSQNWLDLVKCLPRKKLIYYCVDEHSSFKGIDAEEFRKNDEEMARIADFIICSSRQLQLQKAKHNNATYYVPHGVNYELFSRALFDQSLKVPPDVANVFGPVIGFFGHISYDWVDSELLKYLAVSRPAWTVLLIGRYSMNPSEFAENNNILIIGEREYETLPAYCKAISVGIIPFVKSELTENCNPLKLYEYLSAGLPVVSTDIPEIRQFQGQIHIADSHRDFLSLCDQALKERHINEQRKRSGLMASSTWDDRIKNIYQIIAE